MQLMDTVEAFADMCFDCSNRDIASIDSLNIFSIPGPRIVDHTRLHGLDVIEIG